MNIYPQSLEVIIADSPQTLVEQIMQRPGPVCIVGMTQVGARSVAYIAKAFERKTKKIQKIMEK